MLDLKACVARQKAIVQAESSDYTGLVLLLLNAPLFLLAVLIAGTMWYYLHQMSLGLCSALGLGQ
jgi:hypothetical protein